MSDTRCAFTLPNGDDCHLSATIRFSATHSSNWAPPLRDAVITADYCDTHSRVMSDHVRANMPTHWVRLTETLLSAVDLLPVPSH